MKKILYYLSTFPVYSQTFITREIEALQKSGNIDITVLSLKKGTKADIPEALKNKVSYYDKPKYLRILNGMVFFITHPSKAIATLLKYWQRPLTWGTAVSLYPIIKKLNPDIIHANWIADGALMANILSDLTDIPFSIECHAEDIWLSSKENIQKRIKDSKFVITCTKNNANYLKSFIPNSLVNKIYCVYHFLDANLFNGKTTRFNDISVIYLIGRTVEKKGFAYMVKAAKILKDKGLSFEVKFAGDGGGEYSASRKDLINLAKSLGLENTISFLNEVTFEEHNHNFLESDIFVAPSIKDVYGNLDGIPNVIVEAMLAGMPVVASDISAIPEIIDDNVTGFLVPPADEKALANKIELLIGDKDLRLQFGIAGRNKILNIFSYENTIAKIEELFLR